MTSPHIGIIGGGVAALATIGHLVRQSLTTGIMPNITMFQPPKPLNLTDVDEEIRCRAAVLLQHGYDPQHLLGGGMVYDPLEPSLFTFNGDSRARGFDFFTPDFSDNDFSGWVQHNRELLRQLYPDFYADGPQRHPGHDLDDPNATCPRGVYGLYLHDRFRDLQDHLGEGLTVIRQGVDGFTRDRNGLFRVITPDGQDHMFTGLVCATGNLLPSVPLQWQDQGTVCAAYPARHYSRIMQNAPAVTVAGAGPAGVEAALHLLHNLGVGHVTLISRNGYSRLPEVATNLDYAPQFFTPERFAENTTADNAKTLLQQELDNCFATCGLLYPGWEALMDIKDYPTFLCGYLADTDRNPNHPFALLMRPVLGFWRKVEAFVPASERQALRQFLDSTKHLFATQSRQGAEMMLEAIGSGRLRLLAGTVDVMAPQPFVQLDCGDSYQPERLLLATGFGSSPPRVYARALADGLVCADPTSDSGLSCDADGRLRNINGGTGSLFRVHGTSLWGINMAAEKAAEGLANNHAKVTLVQQGQLERA